MSETRNKIVANVTKVSSEKSDFPLVCETCMGDNPYVRMTKMDAGSACQMCERPFTVFRWKAGNKGRFKQTVICQLCARLKNVCQCCLLDLEFGLPIQVRDKYLAENEHVAVATSQQGIDFQVQKAALENLNGSTLAIEAASAGYSKLSENPHLQRIARSAPYYERNEARPCSFFQKGECTRGDMCPFRHVIQKNDTGTIRGRLLGTNDPAGDKMMLADAARLAAMPATPSDDSICTLFVAGIPQTASDEEVLRILQSAWPTDQVVKVHIVRKANCGFVEFTDHKTAEKALISNFGKIRIDDKTISLNWSRPKVKSVAVSAAPYASMDPANVGNAPLKK